MAAVRRRCAGAVGDGVDEMRETSSVIPVAEARVRSTDRGAANSPCFARSRSEINAGNALRYLGDNIEHAVVRIRERRWLSLGDPNGCTATTRPSPSSARAACHWSWTAFCRLELEAIPRPTNKAAIHLAAVVETIRDCEHLAATARIKVNLQRMRAD